jgi:hypothetical protein
VRLLIGLVILGGRRLRHVAYLCDDVVYRRFASGGAEAGCSASLHDHRLALGIRTSPGLPATHTVATAAAACIVSAQPKDKP